MLMGRRESAGGKGEEDVVLLLEHANARDFALRAQLIVLIWRQGRVQ